MLNKWVQISDVYFRGMTFTSEQFEIDYANKIIRIPEQMSSEDFLAAINFFGYYRVNIGYTEDSVGTVTDASVLRLMSSNKLTVDFNIEYIR